jgi:hypothetical protein
MPISPSGKRLPLIVVLECCVSQLLKVVHARVPPPRFAGGLHRGQQEADERADDRDHNQQLNECESAAATFRLA